MRAVYVGVGELVGVPEAQVDVRLRGEMDYGVDVVGAETAPHVGRRGDVALDEGKVRGRVEDARVVERRAVVQLVKRVDAVFGIRQRQVSDEPARAVGSGSAKLSQKGPGRPCCGVHEARAPGDHDVARIGQRLELGRAYEDGRLLPY